METNDRKNILLELIKKVKTLVEAEKAIDQQLEDAKAKEIERFKGVFADLIAEENVDLTDR